MANLVFTLLFCFVLLVLLILSAAASQHTERIRRLTRQSAMLEQRAPFGAAAGGSGKKRPGERPGVCGPGAVRAGPCGIPGTMLRHKTGMRWKYGFLIR